jgi:Uma2 family endonuclease
MIVAMLPPLKTRGWTRVEYERLAETGVLDEDARVELLDGRLIVSEPQGSRHATAVLMAREALERAFGRGFHVRDQLPVALDDWSEPEPDLCVVRGRAKDYRDAHPTSPVLVVEIANESLARDRLRKGPAYARAGIRDYWIVNLVRGVVEVCREPVRAPLSGWRYRQVRLLKRNASIRPLAAPRRVRVADLLP